MAAKKVDALEEKLKAEIGSLKATINERFNNVQQQFSSLEAMLLKLIELHLNPPLAISTSQGGMVGRRIWRHMTRARRRYRGRRAEIH